MKQTIPAIGLSLSLLVFSPHIVQSQTTIKVFDQVLFYDGYAATVATPVPPKGIIRHRNDLYARKLSTLELQSMGTTLSMKVTIRAACDNYDRIGNVNMALVQKGASTYVPEEVQRIEIARFITPFMNKNIAPTEVSYVYTIDHLAAVLKEPSLSALYDIWMELEVFGVPYAANTEVTGCAGRNDVFYGSLDLTTDVPSSTSSKTVLLPLSFKKTLNNYEATATDTIGKTTKTVQFTLPENLSQVSLFLITSNHGANAGGEEYVRRNHFVHFDNKLSLTYKPGRTSCEPFRQYNTQANGIYGLTPRTNAEWQSFSNWCPGDVITTRKIDLGNLPAGKHSVRIRVPDAVFVDKQGYIPFSLYLQGKIPTVLSTASFDAESTIKIYPNPATGKLVIENVGHYDIMEIKMLNVVGATVFHKQVEASEGHTIDLEEIPSGCYILHIPTKNGAIVRNLQVMH